MSSVIITGFLIDDVNEAEFAKHGLRSDAVFQVLESSYVSVPNRRQDKHRARYLLIGRDNGGAPISIPIEPTHIADLWRPVTAWQSGKWEQAILENRGI